jgi:hypothetical protein
MIRSYRAGDLAGVAEQGESAAHYRRDGPAYFTSGGGLTVVGLAQVQASGGCRAGGAGG